MLNDCCCAGCLILDERFVDMSNWTVVAGTWNINSDPNYIYTTDINAVIVTTGNHPNSEAEHILQGTFAGDALDIVRFIVGYIDADNYYFAEVQNNDASFICGYIALYQRVAGINTLLGVVLPAGPLPFIYGTDYQVCFSAEEKTFSAEIGGYALSHTFATTPTAGYKVGFGTGASGTTGLRFYGMTWYKHKSIANPDCVDCAEISNPTACVILDTYFIGYPIGNDPGCRFLEVSGGWDIAETNHLLSPIYPGNYRHLVGKGEQAILQCVLPEPTLSNRHRLHVDFGLLDVLIEAGAFIDYRASNGNRYLGTAELRSDDTIIFHLYNNGVLVDSDILPIVFNPDYYRYQPIPYGLVFSGKVTVSICIDFDGNILRFTYQALDYDYPYVLGTVKHSMYDFYDAVGNTNGYYAGLEVVDNRISLEDVHYYHFEFTRHKVNDSHCLQCDDGCVFTIYGFGIEWPTYPVPCYLKLVFSNFKDFQPCAYPLTKDCDAFNGTWFTSYATVSGSGYWLSGTFTAQLCGSYIYYWKAILGYSSDYHSYYFKVVLCYSSGTETNIGFIKYFSVFPNIFTWNNEDIPFWGGYWGNVCANPADPPLCRVSYADMDVP